MRYSSAGTHLKNESCSALMTPLLMMVMSVSFSRSDAQGDEAVEREVLAVVGVADRGQRLVEGGVHDGRVLGVDGRAVDVLDDRRAGQFGLRLLRRGPALVGVLLEHGA